MVSAHGSKEFSDTDVSSHNRVEYPFETEIGYADERIFEGIETGDGNCGSGSKSFAGEETQECGFAGPICAN